MDYFLQISAVHRARYVASALGVIGLYLLLLASSIWAQAVPGFHAPERPKSTEEVSIQSKAARGEAPLSKLYSHLRVDPSKIERLPALTAREMRKELSEKILRIGVVRSLDRPLLSIEFQQTGYLVERLYKSAYGDAVGTSTTGGAHQLPVRVVQFTEFLPDTQEIGRGFVVGQPGADLVLENNKQAFIAGFIQRSRFTTAYPTTQTPTQFVDAMFTNTGVVPSASERTAAINEFGGAGSTTDAAARARALRRVAENGTLAQQEGNRAFVLMQYFGYLRRNPHNAPDSDYSGYEFWLTKLNQFGGNFVNAEMVKAFIISSEYRQRFGP